MKGSTEVKKVPVLTRAERLFYRDKLRLARYAALADAESFQQICFAIEALGKRLAPGETGLGKLRPCLKRLVEKMMSGPVNPQSNFGLKSFDVLFIGLKDARNDAMHTGAYARHITTDAVALSLMLESALMYEQQESSKLKRLTVGDFMVSTPVTVQPWQTVAQARQTLLLNSFTFLPIWHEEKWYLISDAAVAAYLRPTWPATGKLNQTLNDAFTHGLSTKDAPTVDASTEVATLLSPDLEPTLWLVTQQGYPPSHLAGVLSPFELM